MRYYKLNGNGQILGSYAIPLPDQELVLLATAPDDESKWDGRAWVPDTKKIAIREAEEARVAAKAQALINNLPTWQEVADAIDAVTTIGGLKVVVKKIARVVYWLAKDRAD